MPKPNKPKRRRSNKASYHEDTSSSASTSGSDNEAGKCTESMLSPSPDELVPDFGALAWAPWGARHYPGMVVSGWRCHLRPARPGWRWLLWLAEGKVSEVAKSSLVPLCSEKGRGHLPNSSVVPKARGGSLQHRGFDRLLEELLCRAAVPSQTELGELRELLAKLEPGKVALVNEGGDHCRISAWAEQCLDAMRERHRRASHGSTSKPTATALAGTSKPVASASSATANAATATTVSASNALTNAASVDSDSEFNLDKVKENRLTSKKKTGRSTAARGRKKATKGAGHGGNGGVGVDSTIGEVPGSRPVTDQLMHSYHRPPGADAVQPALCLACASAAGELIAHPKFVGQLCKPCGRRVTEAGEGGPDSRRVCIVCALPCGLQTATCSKCGLHYCQACLTILIGPAAWALAAYSELEAVKWTCYLCEPAAAGLLRPVGLEKCPITCRASYSASSSQPSSPTRPLRVLAMFDSDGLGLKLLRAAGLAVEAYLAISCSSLSSIDGRVVNLGCVEQLDDCRLAAVATPIDLLLAPLVPAANHFSFFEFHRCLGALRRISGRLEGCNFYWLYRAVFDGADKSLVSKSLELMTRFLEREPVPGVGAVWASLPTNSDDFKDNDATVAKASTVSRVDSYNGTLNSSALKEKSSVDKENSMVAKENLTVAKENSTVAKELSDVSEGDRKLVELLRSLHSAFAANRDGTEAVK